MANEEHLKILRQGVEVWNKWREENPEIKPDLAEANLDGVNLCGVNLRNAGLAGVALREADVKMGDLLGVDLRGADLRESNFGNANISKAYLQASALIATDFCNADLRLTDLRFAYLYGAKLIDTDLRWANLRGANLAKAKLNKANITGVNLYGTARDDWEIENIKCDFVFFDHGPRENRIPTNRDFDSGEFEELYQQLPSFEYYFEHGFTPIDAFVMNKVVQVINERYPQFELKLDSFHSKGQPHAVFTVFDKNVAEEALKQIKSDYETRIANLEVERDALERCFNRALEKPQAYIEYSERVEMGDQYNIQGQTGAVGPGAHAHDLNFNQLWNQYSSEIDVAKLADELYQVRQAMKKESETLEHDTAVGEIAAAETAAKDNDGPKALEHLKKAGKWAFSVAENIGTTIAAEVLKKAIGL